MRSRIILISLAAIAAALLVSCEKDSDVDTDYIARVDDKYLSASELDEELDSLRSLHKFRDEFIREWINRELLFSLAVDKGVLEFNEFREVRALSEKELAISFMLKNRAAGIQKSITVEELKSYYERSAEFSTLQDDLYIVNSISLNDPYAADEFRKNLIDSGIDWNSTIDEFDSTAILEYRKNEHIFNYELEAQYISRWLKTLDRNEVSSVFEKEPKVFSIVQLVDRFEKGSMLPYEYVQVDLMTLFVAHKQKEMLESLLDSLYKEYDIEIKSE